MIKRYFSIFIVMLLLINANLFSFDNGIYFAPKFMFNLHETGKQNDKKQKIVNKYIGGGASIGYDFFKTPLLAPVRLELEYGYRDGMTGNYFSDSSIVKVNTHTILAAAYYSFHIFYINKENLTSITADEIYRTRPITSIYLGLLLGAQINDTIIDRWYEDKGKVLVTTSYSKPTFAIGFGTGFDFQLASFINLDLGYRLLYNLDNVLSHEITAGLRIKFPKLWE